jgi:hypothetical protein
MKGRELKKKLKFFLKMTDRARLGLEVLYMKLLSCTLLALSFLISGSLWAQNKAAGKESGGRRKILTQEARTKANKTDIDAAAIDGERRIPAGIAIGGAKQEHEYDLINLRLRWHPEMIKSTSNLETGKGQ